MAESKQRLLLLGAGFSAQHFAAYLSRDLYEIYGTCRTKDKAQALQQGGITPFLFNGQDKGDHQQIADLIEQSAFILTSIRPDETGDPILQTFGQALQSAQGAKWIGYLSTIGVYGNFDGAWVDETTTPRPKSKRAVWRQKAEQDWLALAHTFQKPVHIFRLGGIYGKNRGPLSKIKAGTALRIVKDNQYFNRIHVEDIARCLVCSMKAPASGEIYNVVDDEPAAPQTVLDYAADLLQVAPPPQVSFAQADLSPMARSFYSDSRRVRNDKIRQSLKVDLAYPTYREGLQAQLANMV